jgi:hypothetical protein
MSRSMRSTLGLLVVAFAISAFACGGGGGGGGTGGSGTGSGGSSGTGTGGSSGTGGATAQTPLHKSCTAFCIAEDKCKADTTPAQCEEYTCPPAGDAAGASKDGLSATCQANWVAWWDCLAKQADPCERPGTCTTQATALAGCAP